MEENNFGTQSTPCTPMKRNFDSETDHIDSKYVTLQKAFKSINDNGKSIMAIG